VRVLSGEQDFDRDAYARSSAASHRQQRAVLMAQLQIMDPQGAMVYLASRQVSFHRAQHLLAPFALARRGSRNDRENQYSRDKV